MNQKKETEVKYRTKKQKKNKRKADKKKQKRLSQAAEGLNGGLEEGLEGKNKERCSERFQMRERLEIGVPKSRNGRVKVAGTDESSMNGVESSNGDGYVSSIEEEKNNSENIHKNTADFESYIQSAMGIPVNHSGIKVTPVCTQSLSTLNPRQIAKLVHRFSNNSQVIFPQISEQTSVLKKREVLYATKTSEEDMEVEEAYQEVQENMENHRISYIKRMEFEQVYKEISHKELSKLNEIIKQLDFKIRIQKEKYLGAVQRNKKKTAEAGAVLDQKALISAQVQRKIQHKKSMEQQFQEFQEKMRQRKEDLYEKLLNYQKAVKMFNEKIHNIEAEAKEYRNKYNAKILTIQKCEKSVHDALKEKESIKELSHESYKKKTSELLSEINMVKQEIFKIEGDAQILQEEIGKLEEQKNEIDAEQLLKESKVLEVSELFDSVISKKIKLQELGEKFRYLYKKLDNSREILERLSLPKDPYQICLYPNEAKRLGYYEAVLHAERGQIDPRLWNELNDKMREAREWEWKYLSLETLYKASCENFTNYSRLAPYLAFFRFVFCLLIIVSIGSLI
ncbi:unnamed protein product [Moneuplotes crassus]|uniref:Uncharacterized protein n=1 Tax=Euplotes crassus TaxID=5936 RepID=A0AAD1X9M0_EUPCR|nr:unnamed protein product [Moneuplotes crassus]